MNIDDPDTGRIDTARIDALRALIADVEQLPVDHPDYVLVRNEVAGVYKRVKERRRAERRARILEHDERVTHRTATGAPGRIDDETAGIALVSQTQGAVAGHLKQARGCYICKTRYTQVDAFYHQLCPACAAFSHERRNARADLTNSNALLTGGRAKIGMYIALRLLRDGARLTITTRFPNDAARRFMQCRDSSNWLHRLRIVGIDLRDPAQVVALTDDLSQEGPLHIIINNAAQTVRRTKAAFAPLIAAEAHPLPAGRSPELVTYKRNPNLHLADPEKNAHWSPTPYVLAELAKTARSATHELIEQGKAIDAGGLVPDTCSTNSWIQRVHEVDPVELLEVQLCNQTAPFILLSRLRQNLADGASAASSGRSYVVNVSAMEGVFSRGYKGPGHPHTNMSKAALNMLTRTSAQELFETDRILMTAVDTGWITDERPHPDRVRLAASGFHAPLDLVDGAARVYDPIVRGERGEDLYGVFLKDYRPANW